MKLSALSNRRSNSAISEREQRSPSPLAENEFTVQQIVRLTGLSEHTLRYYERLRLLAPVRREHNSGHRRYSQDDLTRLETLACLRATGMPLAEMRQYFDAMADGAQAAPRQRALLMDHKAVLQERLRQMRRNLEYLDLKIAYWDAIEARDEQMAVAVTASYQHWLRADAEPEFSLNEQNPPIEKPIKETL